MSDNVPKVSAGSVRRRWRTIRNLRWLFPLFNLLTLLSLAAFAVLLRILSVNRPSGNTLFFVDATTSDLSYVVTGPEAARVYLTGVSIRADGVPVVDPSNGSRCVEGYLSLQKDTVVQFSVINGLQRLSVAHPTRPVPEEVVLETSSKTEKAVSAREADKVQAPPQGDEAPDADPKPNQDGPVAAILERSRVGYVLVKPEPSDERSTPATDEDDDDSGELIFAPEGAPSPLVIGDLPLAGNVVITEVAPGGCEFEGPQGVTPQVAFAPRSEPFVIEGPGVLGSRHPDDLGSLGAGSRNTTFISGEIEALVRGSVCWERFTRWTQASGPVDDSTPWAMRMARNAQDIAVGPPCTTVYQLDKQPMPIPTGSSLRGVLDRNGTEPAQLTGQVFFDGDLYRVNATVSANRITITHPSTNVQGIRRSNLEVSFLDRAFAEPWLVLMFTLFLTAFGWVLGVLQIELEMIDDDAQEDAKTPKVGLFRRIFNFFYLPNK